MTKLENVSGLKGDEERIEKLLLCDDLSLTVKM